MTIDMETLRGWLEAGKDVSVLDVRPAAERAEWSIPGSLHVDAYDALRAGDPAALAGVQLPLRVPVVTVCAAGRTSLIAAEVLRARGHTVYSLRDGMKGWSGAWNTAEVPLTLPGLRVIQVRRTGKGCLSYLAAAGGEAVVIDPSVDIGVYLRLAADMGVRISRVVETHVHADHLSRSRALAEASAAALLVPEQKRLSFPHTPIRDNEQIQIGGERAMTALRTPGHTAESTCYWLGGTMIFTGDTLFLDSVGRPDLEAGRGEALARARVLFSSLRRILALPPTTVILPGHTGMPVAFDRRPLLASLSEVKARTPLLDAAEERFAAEVVARIPAAPPNVAVILGSNEKGVLPAVSPGDLEAGGNRCAIA
jgi:glyoxylase-like metal-dependent hydrolase (beta-lactamase superfamily II)/rhodanese-related sulfurtransferase